MNDENAVEKQWKSDAFKASRAMVMSGTRKMSEKCS
jgi:hypothetical protein